jgi:ABC-type multidrug transport system fused ATPase/permease subunit
MALSMESWRMQSRSFPSGGAFALGALTSLVAMALVAARSPRVIGGLLASSVLVWSVTFLSSRWEVLDPRRDPAFGDRWQRWTTLASGAVERRLLALLRPHAASVAGGLAITVALAAIGIAKPWPTKILVDDVFGDGQLAGLGERGALTVAVALTVALFVLGGALSLWQTRVLYGLTQRIIRELRAEMFRHLTRVSLRFHDSNGVGDSTYRISADTYAIHAIVLGGLVPLTSALLTLVGVGVVMFLLDPFLALLSLVSVPAAAAVSRRFGRRIRASSLAVNERESDVYSHAEQTLTGIRTVQAFGREPFEQQRFDDRAHGSEGAMVRLVTQQTVFGLAVDAVLGLGLAAVTWVAATRALDGRLTVGEVLVFLGYAATLYGPVSELAGVFGELQTAAASAQRVFEVLDEDGPADDPAATRPSAPPRGNLCFEQLDFGYVPEQLVLRGIDLEVPAGRTVAIVGPTGAGKSTVVSLLLRLYDPDGGRLLLDGIDVRDVPRSWLRHHIAFVPQDPVLFPDSIRENIRYGRLDATDAEVEEAARQANILEELRAQPQGLDSPVGDRGLTLSGGQRQRVALARAFLKDAPILILDEPTSALDAATEALVMEALWRLRRGRTCVVIAHRLATVEQADSVVVMDGGRIVQQGPHKSLIRQKGLYRELHQARFGRERGRSAVTTLTVTEKETA